MFPNTKDVQEEWAEVRFICIFTSLFITNNSDLKRLYLCSVQTEIKVSLNSYNFICDLTLGVRQLIKCKPLLLPSGVEREKEN